MITITFFNHAEKVGNQCLNVPPIPKWKAQDVQWIHEGKIKPDDKGFTHFEIEGKE
jgi:hypothetical protein